MANYEVRLSGKNPLKITHSELEAVDIQKLSDQLYHSVRNNQSYHAEIIEVDLLNKQVHLSVNGVTYKCDIHDDLDIMITSMDMASQGKEQKKDLVSSMPGLVLSVEVSEGDEVTEGTTLMILEAMKMENVLKAGSDGVIKNILCKPKDSVEKGQLLIEIE